MIADSFNLLVHIEHRKGGRYISQVLEVDGYDSAIDDIALETLYQRDEPAPETTALAGDSPIQGRG